MYAPMRAFWKRGMDTVGAVMEGVGWGALAAVGLSTEQFGSKQEFYLFFGVEAGNASAPIAVGYRSFDLRSRADSVMGPGHHAFLRASRQVEHQAARSARSFDRA
jgi:hypothetical protein